MNDGVKLWELPADDLALLVGVGLAYLLVGYLVFQYIQGLARRRGVLGDY